MELNVFNLSFSMGNRETSWLLILNLLKLIFLHKILSMSEIRNFLMKGKIFWWVKKLKLQGDLEGNISLFFSLTVLKLSVSLYRFKSNFSCLRLRRSNRCKCRICIQFICQSEMWFIYYNSVILMNLNLLIILQMKMKMCWYFSGKQVVLLNRYFSYERDTIEIKF